jgi:hypothetical protein
MDWISVKDRLPPEGELVLRYGKILDRYQVDYVILFEDSSEPYPYIWASTLYDECVRITHWMPLPLPPEENGKGILEDR